MGSSRSISEARDQKSTPVVGVIEPGYADYSVERRVLAQGDCMNATVVDRQK